MPKFVDDDHWPRIILSREPKATNLSHFPARLSIMLPDSFERRSNERSKPSNYQNKDCTSDDHIAFAADSRNTASISTIDLKMHGEERAFRRVRYMLEHLVPKNYAANLFENSRIPLIQTAAQGNARWVQELLLSSDIEPDLRSFQGWTALEQGCIAKSGQVKAVVKQLIKHGANVNATPGYGDSKTALQAACAGGRRPLAELLLSYGADVHAPPAANGQKALDEACINGNRYYEVVIGEGSRCSSRYD